MKKYAIITFNKNHILISEEENERLKNVRLDTFFKSDDGNRIKGSEIAEVLTMEKYYECYPAKRPPITDQYKKLPGIGMRGVIDNSSHVKVLRSMAGGLRKYLVSKNYQGGDGPKEILNRIDGKIKILKTA